MPFQGPPPDILQSWYPEIVDFVHRVRAAYRICPMGCTSWWRSVARNRQVGGNEYSQHLIATAADLYPAQGFNLDQLHAALRGAGLGTVRYRTHIHAQLHRAGYLARWALD